MPNQRWKDKIKKDLKDFGIRCDSWWTTSDESNRIHWRKQIFDGAIEFNNYRTKHEILKRKKRKERERKQTAKVKPKGSFKCPVCAKYFSQSSSLNRHVYRFHPSVAQKGGKDFTCPNCDLVCKSKSGLTRHKNHCLSKRSQKTQKFKS